MLLLDHIHLILPESILLTTACLALLVDLFFAKKAPYVSLIVSIIGLFFVIGILYAFINEPSQVILGGLFVFDSMAVLMKMVICFIMIPSFVYVRRYNQLREIPLGDFYVLALFSTLGMMILISAHSLLMIYLGIELLSLPLYALVAIQRRDGFASEGAMKYFVMGALASGMLLYGISLMYGATGQLDMTALSQTIPAVWDQKNTMLVFAMVLIVAGLGFKLASVPFHMWVPDVYQGAPSSVVLLIGAAPKIAGIAMAIRLLVFAMPSLTSQWQQIILIMALLSAVLGNILALVQTNLKRLFAYSAISHSGYALFGLLSGTAFGYAATIYYALIYALTSVAVFGFLVLLSTKEMEFDQIDSLKGLNQRHPWLAFMMLIVLFSLAGVPPTVGFFAKLLVLKALIASGFLWLAVLGLLFAVVGAYYYIRLVKMMYFDDPIETHEINISRIDTALYSVNALLLLYLGIFPAGLIYACIDAMK